LKPLRLKAFKIIKPHFGELKTTFWGVLPHFRECKSHILGSNNVIVKNHILGSKNINRKENI